MCDKTRSTHSLLSRIIAVLDIETAGFAYDGQIDKAKASSELASVIHDGLVKYSQSVARAEANFAERLSVDISKCQVSWDSTL